ncbi:MAG: GGDEF domain-containing protein [Pseudomonadota bacterium]
MKIRDTGGVAPTSRTASNGKTTAASSSPSPQSVSDVATIMGVPEGELTPKVRQAIDRLMAEVENLRGELENTRKRVEYLERLADEDSLVPVLNRRAFVRELTRTASFAERYGITSSVIYFDLNGMKQINDSLGHAAGDQALQHLAKVLIASVRASDVVGRLGGDEFGVILAQSDHDTATAKAVRLAQNIADQPMQWRDEAVPLVVAYGVHTLTAGEKVDDALEAADRAMYVNKRAAGPSGGHGDAAGHPSQPGK